jgi:hypothetical protein
MSIVEANVTELAQIMGVRRERVYKAERGGRIERKPNGKFDVEQTQKDWAANSYLGRGGNRCPLCHRDRE